MSAKYIVGIDFGTTNSTMAYAPIDGGDGSIAQFDILQISSAGELKSSHSLPSFFYYPLVEELKGKKFNLPWNPKNRYCVGEYARERGSELPARLITSPKSWLCHSGIDRREKILPHNSEDIEEKKSPLEACSALLEHLRSAWDGAMDLYPLADQQVFLTVPASFDPSARQLILEAAELAGFPTVVLIEEPQAAFYAWLHSNGDKWREQLTVGDAILVVDIGGGTTDFTIIAAVDDGSGNVQLDRIAVGSHLLLGGDNIDLRLAYGVKEKFEGRGDEIDDWQFNALVHSCRTAKESLLAENAPTAVDVVVMGRGSKLIGKSIKVSLSRDELLAFLLDGFLPIVTADQFSQSDSCYAIQQLGLPYAEDPRITAQLAKFLSQTGEGNSRSVEKFIIPTAVLFNGGSAKAQPLREKLLQQLNLWSEQLGEKQVRELSGGDYDNGVSRGAVYYGLARNGQGIRIKSGTSRSYFVGIEDATPAIPGVSRPLKALCVAPFGMEEGGESALEGREFALRLGEMATFRFFSHATQELSDGTVPVMGTCVKRWQHELTELHPIETMLDIGEGEGKTANIRLITKVTEMGVLELWCVAADGRRWKLEFDVREERLVPLETGG